MDDRDRLIRMLRTLPPQQRTAIVLRYWDDLSEGDAARAMGCSAGTVKAAASRGMARLRELGAASEKGGGPDNRAVDHDLRTTTTAHSQAGMRGIA